MPKPPADSEVVIPIHPWATIKAHREGIEPAVVGCCPDVTAGAPVVKEPRRCVTQGNLIGREIEVHGAAHRRAGAAHVDPSRGPGWNW